MQIIYIVGYERSGSTLLHNILAESDDTFGVGELRHFKRRLYDNRPCSCQKNIYECEFWKDFAFNADRNSLPDYTRDKFVFLGIILKVYFRFFKKREVRYFEKLYKYAFQKSGKVIVDSSKSLVHLFLLKKLLNYDVKVIHIVRNPTGILYSIKKRVEKNHEKYSSNNLTKVLLKIDFVNFVTHFFAKRIAPTCRVKYEDIVVDYEKTLLRVSEKLDLNLKIPQKKVNNMLIFGSSHSVDGGPSRHAKGEVTLKLDSDWEKYKAELPSTKYSFTYRKFYKK